MLVNIERFIANKIAFSQNNSFTQTIMRIAIASVALCIAVVILTTAVITGFKNEITQKIFGFWGHIDITNHAVRRNYEAIPIDNTAAYIDSIKRIRNVSMEKIVENSYGKQLKTIKSKAGVDYVQSVCLIPGIIKTSSEFESIIVKGIGKDFRWEHLNDFIVEGERLDLTQDDMSNGILISEHTAKTLSLEVGQEIRVTFLRTAEQKQIPRKFKIQGLYKTGLQEYDVRFAIADIRKIQQVFGWEDNQVMGMEVFIEDIDDLNILNDFIYLDVLPGQMYSETVRAKFPAIFGWLELQNINEYVILSLMTIVAVINMITALLILMLERSRMIGVLKALGSNNWSIRKIFLIKAFHIIKWGLIIGNAAGLFICFIQKKFQIIKLNEENYYLSSAPIELNIPYIILLNVGVVSIILLFLIIPTYLITRMSPVKVLRFN